ncbi:hypothetical protein BLNAU_16694 [Blattamonas nauphoetae]|uniref:Uncharacterized protein n=1 Tax=Blattamonas nauphoetae TaxID=2049346 RepID=A0ABQ9XAQ1_9EUKA|nr:hypothetical protein BLNAU_16694 [Blattamonas nauphoetae]
MTDPLRIMLKILLPITAPFGDCHSVKELYRSIDQHNDNSEDSSSDSLFTSQCQSLQWLNIPTGFGSALAHSNIRMSFDPFEDQDRPCFPPDVFLKHTHLPTKMLECLSGQANQTIDRIFQLGASTRGLNRDSVISRSHTLGHPSFTPFHQRLTSSRGAPHLSLDSPALMMQAILTEWLANFENGSDFVKLANFFRLPGQNVLTALRNCLKEDPSMAGSIVDGIRRENFTWCMNEVSLLQSEQEVNSDEDKSGSEGAVLLKRVVRSSSSSLSRLGGFIARNDECRAELGMFLDELIVETLTDRLLASLDMSHPSLFGEDAGTYKNSFCNTLKLGEFDPKLAPHVVATVVRVLSIVCWQLGDASSSFTQRFQTSFEGLKELIVDVMNEEEQEASEVGRMFLLLGREYPTNCDLKSMRSTHEVNWSVSEKAHSTPLKVRSDGISSSL